MFGVFAGSSLFGLSSNFQKNILSDMNPSMDISSLGLTNLHTILLKKALLASKCSKIDLAFVLFFLHAG